MVQHTLPVGKWENINTVMCCLVFYSPLAYLDPLHTNLLHMFAQLFRDALTEYTYAAELAGLTYCLSNTKYGLTVSVKYRCHITSEDFYGGKYVKYDSTDMGLF